MHTHSSFSFRCSQLGLLQAWNGSVAGGWAARVSSRGEATGEGEAVAAVTRGEGATEEVAWAAVVGG